MGNLKLLNKNKCLKIFTVALVLVWSAVIFYLSHQNANDSGSSSLDIIKYVIESVLNIDLTISQLDNINSIFRTFMHGFVYFVLSFLSIIACYTNNVKRKYIVALIFTFIYSITDEIHQHFIPGRVCDINDIIMDLIGSITAIGVYICLTKMLKYVNRKNDKIKE